MGAWGVEVFHNDDALDWLGELEDRGAAAVSNAFSAVVESETDGYIEVDVGNAGLAAAEAVAFAFGKVSLALSEREKEVLGTFAAAIRGIENAEAKALTVIDIIMADPGRSELLDLWSGDGGGVNPGFLKVVDDLRGRLQ